MKITPAKIFVVIAIAVIGFAIYDYKKSTQDETAKIAANRIFKDRVSADIQSFRMKSFIAEVALEQLPTGWQVTFPVKDKADESAVAMYLASVLNQDVTKIEAAPKDWAQYGLDTPDASIEIQFKDSKALLEFGKIRAVGNGYYIRKDGHELVVGSEQWASLIHRAAVEFRDRQLFAGADEASEIKLVKGKSEVVIAVSPPPANSDVSKLQSYTTLLQNAKADLVVAEKAASPQELAQFGLDKPVLTVEIKGATNTVVRLSRKRDNVYAQVSGRPQVYQATEALLGSIEKDRAYFDKAPAAEPSSKDQPSQ